MQFLRDKNILIISPESWGISYLSKHHYALELARIGNRVWFLNSPYYNRDVTADEIELLWPNIKIVDDFNLKGLSRLPKFLQKNIIQKQATRLQKKLAVKFDLVWSFDNSRYFFLDVFDSAFRIHHVVDVQMNYQLAKACATAHLCLSVTTALTIRSHQYNSNTHFIEHGFANFVRTEVQLISVNVGVNVCYVGNLLVAAFDIELMQQLAEKHTNVNFHLVGSFEKCHLNFQVNNLRRQQILDLEKLPNVWLYGELKYDDAFTVAAQCDVLCLMYFNSLEEIGNSSKILPYLATGKVVISDYLSAYDDLQMLEMAKTKEEYLSLFQRVIINIEEFNKPENSNKRKAFANQNSYSNHLQRIDHLIYQTTA